MSSHNLNLTYFRLLGYCYSNLKFENFFLLFFCQYQFRVGYQVSRARSKTFDYRGPCLDRNRHQILPHYFVEKKMPFRVGMSLCGFNNLVPRSIFYNFETSKIEDCSTTVILVHHVLSSPPFCNVFGENVKVGEVKSSNAAEQVDYR